MTTLIIDSKGQSRCLYSEEVDLRAMGTLQIVRASHVEPDAQGQWWADLSPVVGPRLGPFPLRSEALAAERHWLESNLTSLTCSSSDGTTPS